MYRKRRYQRNAQAHTDQLHQGFQTGCIEAGHPTGVGALIDSARCHDLVGKAVLLRKQQHIFFFEIIKRDLILCVQMVIAWVCDPERFSKEWHLGEIARSGRGREQDCIQLVVLEFLQQLFGCGLSQLQRKFRVLLLQLEHKKWHQVRAEGVDGTHPQRTGQWISF